MKVFVLYTLFLLIGNNTYAQSQNIDSLINITKSYDADTIKIKAYLKLYEKVEYSQTDTAIYFCKKALEYINNGLKFYTDIDYKMGMGVCFIK